LAIVVAILARNFSVKNWERQEERKRAYRKKRNKSIQGKREMVSEQPSSTAEIR
jgi:hypothetical protein